MRKETDELRQARHVDVAILRGEMGFERRSRFAAPDLHALGNHTHGVDDLRIACHRIGSEIGAHRKRVCLRVWHRSKLLVGDCDDEQN